MRFRKLRLNNHDGTNHGLRIFVLVGVAVLVTFLSSLPSYDDDNESLPSSNGGGQPEEHQPDSAADGWTFYDGDLNEYYNKLERDEHDKRNPSQITSYAVHRWIGPDCSTLVHYELIRKAIYEVVLGKHPASPRTATSSDGVEKLRVFDAGCGLGAGLMWFEAAEPRWELVGHTISEEQHRWIVEDLPRHNFTARLRTYDEPLGVSDPPFDAVYSIEAAIHSPSLKRSLRAWSKALRPGGAIVIIDDFLSVGVSRDDPDVDLFARSWVANALHTTPEIAACADKLDGMKLVRDRDLGSEFQIVKRNYRNKVPALRDENGRVHQGWLGSKVRQKLMVEGKISYRMIVLQREGAKN